MEGVSSHKGLKLRHYDIKFKLKVIQYAKDHGNRQAERYFKVDRKRVREWRKIEDDLLKVTCPRIKKRRPGGGRKVRDVDIDMKVNVFCNLFRQSQSCLECECKNYSTISQSSKLNNSQ